mmetsp:Transcript_81230/g.128477  ORF Transcript_81230/g.128477 Transcript_81230/m.128477 type:complete len:256 (-) Transcript_81230:6-773(-)
MAPGAACLNFASMMSQGSSFVVIVNKPPLTPSGFSIRYNDDVLLVTRVLEDTPMDTWNRQNPTRQVVYGSRVKSVNGKRNVPEMIIALQESCDIRMEVARSLEIELLDEMISRDKKMWNPLLEDVFNSLPERHCSCCKNTSCAVCLEEFDDEMVLQLPCKHAFHRDCISGWLLNRSTRCPLCNQVVDGSGKLDEARDALEDAMSEPTQPVAEERSVMSSSMLGWLGSRSNSRSRMNSRGRMGSRSRARCVSRISL